VIAITNSDETNILICFLSKELGAGMTVARVRNPEYSGYFLTAAKSPSAPRKVVRPKSLGVDLFINPEVAVADELINLLCGVCLIPVSNFADGRVQIGEFNIEQERMVNRPLNKIRFPEPCVVAAIIRAGKAIIPDGEISLEVGDHIYLVASPESMDKFSEIFTLPQPPVRSVVVFGGGRIGLLIAEGLEKQGVEVKVIEQNPNRSQEIAARLKRATVIQGDATDQSFLTEQGVSSADAFVSTTESDELNMLCALLANNLGVPRSLIVLTKPGYIALAEAIGIDVAVSPLVLTASKVSHFVLHGRAISSAYLGGEELQAIEFVVSSTSSVAERNVSEAGFPKEVIIAAIVHNDMVIIPPEDRVIKPGDHVIVITPLSLTPDIERLFK
ncbi:Trk system potassium transporter TrkA, partial [Chloroflexota bacterium]